MTSLSEYQDLLVPIKRQRCINAISCSLGPYCSRSPLRLPLDALHHLKALNTHTVHAIHETLKHKLNPPPLQHTTVPRSWPLSHTHTHTHTYCNPTLNPNTVISPSHIHTLFDPPTLPLTIVSVCCSLYLMHAGPPQSGHGCPERQVCDLPTLVLWFSFGLKFGCQFSWR